jgi:hypothetical protein
MQNPRPEMNQSGDNSLNAHATGSTKGGKDGCGDRCDDLQRPLECFFLSHSINNLMV